MLTKPRMSSNPFAILDSSDDEAEQKPKHPTTDPAASSHKQSHLPKGAPAHQPRKEMQKEEQDLQQKKKGLPGARGGQHGGPAGVAHPGERSKTAPQREPHVSTHVKPQDGEAKAHGGRVFDRHSGSGRGRELKKGGAGGHNWGKAGEVVTPAAAGTPEPSATGEVAVTEPVAFEPVVEEDPTLTLEEYKEKLAAKRSGAAFEVKQARKITADIKGTVYKKDEEIGEGDYIKLGKEEEKKDVVAKKTTKKTFETNFLSYEAPKPSFEGGGSRGGRGGSTRGGSPREGGAPRAPRPDGDSDAPRAPRPDAGSDAPRGGRGGAFVPRGGRGGARPVTAGARPVTAGARPAAVGRFDVADQDSFPKLGGAA